MRELRLEAQVLESAEPTAHDVEAGVLEGEVLLRRLRLSLPELDAVGRGAKCEVADGVRAAVVFGKDAEELPTLDLAVFNTEKC